MGKTSLSVEYAYRFRGLYAGVWWCPAQSRLGLLSSLAAFGAALGAVSADEADVEKVAQSALRALAEQRSTWLLVYDNVTSPEDIADLLPAAGARLLITSRFSDWGGWAEEVALDVLPIEEAIAFLQERSGFRDEAGARVLAEALGSLPLALDHAAAFCRSAHQRLADYAAKASQRIADDPPRARRTAYPRSVAATFDLAITEAVERCAAAEALMAFFAACAPERIPMILVEGAIENEPERLKALAALTELSLVRRDPFDDGAPAVSVHRLVQTVARTRSEGMGTAEDAVANLITRLAAIYPSDSFIEPKSWRLCAELTSHLLTLRAAGFYGTSKVAESSVLLNRAGEYLSQRAAYAQAGPLISESLAIREKTLGAEYPDVAASLNNLGLLLMDEGDIAGARPHLERALAIREKTLGAGHPDTATSLTSLGLVLRGEGDRAGARALWERALAIQEKTLGAEHPDVAASLNNLGLLRYDERDLSGARPLFERALAIDERAFGPEHPRSAQLLDNLAHIIRDEGDIARARPLFERALAISEKG